jgi:hypothetical protein
MVILAGVCLADKTANGGGRMQPALVELKALFTSKPQ